MLRGFCEEGYPLYVGSSARKIIPGCEELIEEELGKGSTVFFICDRHDPDDKEFQMFPTHCVKGTAEAEVIPELRRFPGEEISKNRYSAFFNTGLEEKLKELNPEKIVICGVCTDICVLHTTADARNRDYDVEVAMDCVTTFDAAAHEHALRHLKEILGAQLVKSSGKAG
jgi:nicotinamidase-related amidase